MTDDYKDRLTIDIREENDKPLRLTGDGGVVCVGGPNGMQVVYDGTPNQVALMMTEALVGVAVRFPLRTFNQVVRGALQRVLASESRADLLGDAKLFEGDTFEEMVKNAVEGMS